MPKTIGRALGCDRHAGLFAVILATILLATANVRADPIPIPGLLGVTYEFMEDVDSFSLLIAGDFAKGPTRPMQPGTSVVQNALLSLGTLWPVSLNITTVSGNSGGLNNPGVDSVLIIGSVFHLAQPHPPEDEGAKLDFSFAISGVTPPPIPSVPSAIRAHESHQDFYALTGDAHYIIPPLADWKVQISGIHQTAEPSSFFLMLIGLAVLGRALAREPTSTASGDVV